LFNPDISGCSPGYWVNALGLRQFHQLHALMKICPRVPHSDLSSNVTCHQCTHHRHLIAEFTKYMFRVAPARAGIHGAPWWLVYMLVGRDRFDLRDARAKARLARSILQEYCKALIAWNRFPQFCRLVRIGGRSCAGQSNILAAGRTHPKHPQIKLKRCP
jgi:hypothetical protein